MIAATIRMQANQPHRPDICDYQAGSMAAQQRPRISAPDLARAGVKPDHNQGLWARFNLRGIPAPHSGWTDQRTGSRADGSVSDAPQHPGQSQRVLDQLALDRDPV